MVKKEERSMKRKSKAQEGEESEIAGRTKITRGRRGRR